MITKNLNQALFAAMFGEDTEVIVEKCWRESGYFNRA